MQVIQAHHAEVIRHQEVQQAHRAEVTRHQEVQVHRVEVTHHQEVQQAHRVEAIHHQEAVVLLAAIRVEVQALQEVEEEEDNFYLFIIKSKKLVPMHWLLAF